MKPRIIELICCPRCKGELEMLVFRVDPGTGGDLPLPFEVPRCSSVCAYRKLYPGADRDCPRCFGTEVLEGLLYCADHHFFPIHNGVPRLVRGALQGFASLVENYREQIPDSLRSYIQRELGTPNPEFNRFFKQTQKSFSIEWDMLDSGDYAWGRDVEERRKMFQEIFGQDKRAYQGQLLLDAGCGHGEVEAAISGLGLEVFAFDLSSSVDELANRRKALSPDADHLIHLFQANVMEPPFRVEAFDYVHSAGVLHHTPDTVHAFGALSACVQPGGKYYIEVYSAEHKNPIVYWTSNVLRIFTTRMPLTLLKWLCLVTALFLWSFNHVLNKVVGKKIHKPLTVKDITLSIFDCFSPPYQHHHTTEEVMGWFRQLGYRDMAKTFENECGFGITGIRKQANVNLVPRWS